MSKRRSTRRKPDFVCAVVLVAIVTVFWFAVARGGNDASAPKRPDTEVSILERAHPEVRRQILRATMQSFEPSLEMKENVDFLLTPALLVQEAISEDVVITYPSE